MLKGADKGVDVVPPAGSHVVKCTTAPDSASNLPEVLANLSTWSEESKPAVSTSFDTLVRTWRGISQLESY